jgi:hypothetical protein
MILRVWWFYALHYFAGLGSRPDLSRIGFTRAGIRAKTMIVNYASMITAIYNTLIGNNLFNPGAADNQRIVNQVTRKRFIPGPPLPAITIKILSSQEIWRTIGYTPWLSAGFNVTIWCSLPNDKATSAVLTALNLNSIKEDWESEQEMLYIQSKLEEFIRSNDNDPACMTYRTLGINGVTGINAHILERVKTVYGDKREANMLLRFADNTFILPNTKIV